MNKNGSLYIEKDSIIHQMDGSIKLLMLLGWTVFIFMFMDIRIFIIMTAVGFALLKISKIPFGEIKALFWFVVGFTFVNSILLMIITPEFGSEASGSFTPLITILGRSLTAETVFYALTLSFKYLSILPITLIFVFTTHPSRFASSLNRIGISYRVAYAVNIALRYIPDVQVETRNIINAQEIRGVSFNKKDTNILQRLKNYTNILVPLLISSLNRVEIVSNAMELRGFGKHKKRTWYNRRPIGKADILFLFGTIALVVIGIIMKSGQDTTFWYPF